MHCEIEEGTHFYFFKTEEHQYICPQCKSKTTKKTHCDKCDLPKESTLTEREGKISKIDHKDYACCCEFGSFWGESQHWKEKGSTCKHYKRAIKEVEQLESQTNQI